MNRREALTKLAAGGATLVGVTAVSSRVVFAGAPPSNLPNPSVAFVNNGGNNALGTSATNGRIEISFSTGFTCGGSATQKRVRWDYEVVPTNMNTPAATIPFGTDQLTTTGPPASSPLVSISWTRPGGGPNILDLTIRAEFTCAYPSGDQTVCVSYSYTFERSGTNWTQTGPSFGSACPVAP